MATATVTHRVTEVTLTLTEEEARYLLNLTGPEAGNTAHAIFESLDSALNPDNGVESIPF